ncbi:MAG TPA: hypothetical protein VGD77_04130 [Gemmatimonadaceae bacterium]|jgi:hypothetical protein
MNSYRDSNGVNWAFQVTLPGSSNAMIIFRHPDGQASGSDRYNWIISQGPEARSVTSRLDPEKVRKQLTEAQVRKLFERSMPVSRREPLHRS